MRQLKIFLRLLCVWSAFQGAAHAQTCPAPSINAQAGTGPSTTICSGQCATLTATVVPVNSTTNYTVGTVGYAPFPYSGGVAAIGAVDDVWSSVINIGFSFCYFGNNFTQLIVGSNGEISFNIANAGAGENFTVNNILPNTTEHPVNTICGPYRDIDPSAGGTVMTYTTGVAPCRKFVAYWSNVPEYGCNTNLATFQIVLHESSNMIEVNVQSSPACIAWQNGKGLIGIQNSTGTTAVAPATRNVLTPWSATNEAWRFTPTGAPTFTVNWSGPGGFTATGLTATPCPTATGSYTATMTLSECTGGTITTFTSAPVQVSVAPTPTVNASASPTAICIGGSSTLTATGATSYTWQPGNLIGASVIVNPGSTTIYTVSGQSGICSGTATVQVVVNSTVSASASPTSICSGASATLTGNGAATYTWNPGNLTGSPVVVSPTVTTVYTVSGTNPGCTSSNTVQVTVTPGPAVSAFDLSGTVCAGTTASLVGTGALTYTWNPGNINGNIVTVTPTTTTIYTVSGSVGSCIGTNTVLVPVNGGPTITVVSSPTLTCPGNSATLTASGALSYTWNPGAIVSNSIVVSPLVTTTYSVTGINALGCQSTFTVNQTVSPVPSITISPVSPSLCIGSSATLTASGASTYTWNPGALTGSSVVVSPTVNTTYTIIGSNGTCTSSATSTLTVVPVPTVSASSSTTQICSGGSATLTGTGATSYTWNPGALTGSNVVVSPTVTTTYTLTGANAGGCTGTAVVSVTVNPTPTITASSSPTAMCTGSTATLTASGAATYTWNPGGMSGPSVTVSPASGTTYTVTGTLGSCSSTGTVFLMVSPIPTVTASSNPVVICSGKTATLTGSGAASYTWNPGALTGATVAVSPTVTTTYIVTGATAGCSSTGTVILTVNPSPTVTAAASPTNICSGSSTTLTASGATSYTWIPGVLIGATVTDSPSSTTTYTVRGSNGVCTNTATVLVLVTPTPTTSATSSPTAICIGDTATLTGSGAATYTWNPGNLSGASVTVSPASTTVYTVTGANGACTNSNTVMVTVNPTPTISAVSNPTAICSGNTATLTGSGATSYTWNPGGLSGTSVTVSPVATTIYTVTGANAGGCTNTGTVSLTVNGTPTLTVSSTPTAICSGNTATLTGSGATSYTWNPGALSGATVTVSPAVTTTYTLTGTNGAGCSSTNTITLNVTTTPTVSASVSPTIICSGATATLTGSGATTYTWNPGALSGATVAVTPTATTVYTLTGANGICSSNTQTVSLTVIASPTLAASASPTAICSGASSTLSASGALSYTWNPGALIGASVAVTPASTTIYTVSGTNGAGCTSSKTVTVNVTTTPTVTASSTPTAICAGATAALTGSGATTYTWNPGGLSGTSVTVSPVATTIYTVTGANGTCTNTKTVSLTVNANPTLTAVSNPTVICSGATATLSGSGAISYTWNPGPILGGTVTVSPTVTTVYTLTGSNGTCSNTKTVSVTVNPSPTLTVTSTPTAICSGATATLSGSGAISYTWNPGPILGATVVVTPASTTVYTVTGTSAAGCTGSKTLTLTVTPTPTVTAVSNPSIMCAGSTSTLTGSGATTYTWNPGGLSGTSVTVSPASSTVYTVTGANGSCTNTKTVSVTIVPGPTITIVASKTSLCSGDSAFLQASGAVSYTWNPGAIVSSGISVFPVTTTIYTVTGSNIVGCTSSKTIQINVTPTPTLNITGTPTAVCAGSSATLTASGATTYTWNPGALTGTSVVVTPTTTTIYTVTGANGACTSTRTFTLIVNTIPVLGASASPTVICAGATVTLTGTGATTYTWNPGALTGATVAVTPTLNTTYTLTGANGACATTKTVSITVNPSPTLTANSTPTNICSGNSATLTSTGAISYTWNPGALTGGTIIVTPSVSTVYSVTGSNAGGCTTTRTVALTVTPTPTLTASSSPTLLCRGSSATLTATGATTYTWNPGALPGSTVVVSPLGPTTYTVRGANGPCVRTTTLTLNVVPTPTVNAFANPNPVCAGLSTTLTAFGAASFTWNPGALTGGTVVVTPTATTVYTVTGANPSGCTNSRTVTVNVIPSPTVNVVSSPTAVCTGGSATLTASGAPNFTWMPGPVTGNTLAVTPTATTIYTVTGANIAGCRTTTTLSLMVVPFPTVTASGSPTIMCSGQTATLTGTGATTYSWTPGALTGSMVTVTPTTSTTYTLTGANGLCISTATVSLSVIPVPTVTAAESSTAICAGSTVTLTTSGATTYTWNPGAITGATISVTPTVTTTYTVSGDNGSGCTGSATITVLVNTPTVTTVATATSICVSGTVGISASGASTYTWNPGGVTTSTVVVSPTVTTVYTVNATNVSGCTSSDTVRIVVNAMPSVTASATPTLLCAGYTSTLTAAGATTYSWNPGAMSGPTVVITPTASTVYTLVAANGACQVTQTLQVNTISSPTVAVGNSGPITCTLSAVNLTGTVTGTNLSFLWTGPGSFTSSVLSPTNITAGGTYTFVVKDTISGCITTATTAIITSTTVPITATIMPSTCTGTVSNNNGTILVSGFAGTDEFDFVAGSTYTGTATYATAAPIPTTGIVTNTLSNPMLPMTYTIRFFGINGCFKDTTLTLMPNSCVPNTDFGLAKAVGTPSLQSNGSYNVTYTVIAVNSGTNTLNNVVLTESLTATFPAPATYSVISLPMVVNAGSSLTINSTFNGNTNASITTATSSTMPPSRKDTIVFTVNVVPNGFFGPFNNSVLGVASSGTTTLSDISTSGLNADPDADGNYANNSLPTVLSLQPSLFFGLTKEGTLSDKLDDGSYDITYTIKVHNLGNDTLRNITVKDSITLTNPAQFTIKNGPTTTGSLTADAAYNGNSSINLLIPATSKIAPGMVNSIVFTINVKPDTVTVIKNSAFGSATHGTVVVADTSDTGSNPDTNGNGIANEAVDNMPTILIIPNTELFIPEGFSPNGDGKNDMFVIRGLNKTVDNTLTVYNRWGNKVYSKNNYDNTWDGTPNASGTLGNQKLPQGTYYYILEIKDGTKPVYGFVILQY